MNQFQCSPTGLDQIATACKTTRDAANSKGRRSNYASPALKPVYLLNRYDLEVALGLENLLALVHAGLQVDVVRTVQFTGLLVFNIGCARYLVTGTAHAALGRRGFSLWNSHDKLRMCVGRIVRIGGGQREILDRKDLNGEAYNVTGNKTPDLNYGSSARRSEQS